MEANKTSPKKAKRALQGCGACSLLLLFIVVVGTIAGGGNKSEELVQTPTTPTEVGEEEATVKLLGTDHNNAVENFDFLVTTTDLSEENISEVAENIKNENCSRKCNVWLYDDESAYDLQKEYDSLDLEWREDVVDGNLTMQQLEENIANWEAQNYVFVADHYVGSLTFDTVNFWMYPFKDSKYATLKGN